eukprot:8975661-Pyramimonas_sp.AAC.1
MGGSSVGGSAESLRAAADGQVVDARAKGSPSRGPIDEWPVATRERTGGTVTREADPRASSRAETMGLPADGQAVDAHGQGSPARGPLTRGQRPPRKRAEGAPLLAAHCRPRPEQLLLRMRRAR